MKTKLFISLIVLTIFYSCKKDNSAPNPPVTNFLASDTSIVLSMTTDTIKFLNLSKNIDTTDKTLSIKWYFYGGSPETSTLFSPTVIYSKSGHYSVKLVISNENGKDSLIKNDYIIAKLPDGLVAYYPFNGNATDGCGNGNNGIVYRATLTSDRFGNSSKAYYFNGIDNYIQIPSNKIAYLNTYSYCLWIKPDGIPTNYSGMVYTIGDSISGQCQAFVYQPTSTFFACSYNNGDNPKQSYSKSGITEPDQWIYFVITRDNNNIKMYINNQVLPIQTSSVINSQTAYYGLSPKAILGGRCNLNYDSFYKGIIDDFRIYDRVLTDSEINDLYKLK